MSMSLTKTQRASAAFSKLRSEVPRESQRRQEELLSLLSYDEVAAETGCFHKERLATLRQAGPLQQMWRDHLLVGAHHKVDGFDDACFVFLYPEVNTACAAAVAAYRHCLSDARTFEAWTLETFVSGLR